MKRSETDLKWKQTGATEIAKWRAANPERQKLQWRRKSLRKKFGMTIEQYDTIAIAQSGVCAICGGVDPDRRLAVDHNHQTNEVRGLLCLNCNHGIGKFKDDPNLLRKAAEYLIRPLGST